MNLLTPYLGEIAALTTSLCWSATATFFTLAGRQVGSMVVNRVRLILAVIFLAATHWFLLATPLPLHAEPERWYWLALSGVIGLVVADGFLFQSFLLVGPHLGTLLMSLSPVVSALLAWLFLAESLQASEIIGILLTIGGVVWVIWVRRQPDPGLNPTPQRGYLWGILFGLGAATGQAVGLIMAKKGLGGDFPALSGNVIRMLTAASVMWAVTLAQGQTGATVQRLMDRRWVMFSITGGAFFGPFIGVWCSLIAIQLTQVGIASTLMALPPIFLLPIGYFIFKEPLRWQHIAGTVIALVGVGILFLV